MTRFSLILVAAALAGGLSVPASAANGEGSSAAQTCQASPVKKKGFGLGGLLGAAKRAGVGDMLGGRMGGGLFGSGRGGQIANAVAGTAMEAASGAAERATQPKQPVGNCETQQEEAK